MRLKAFIQQRKTTGEVIIALTANPLAEETDYVVHDENLELVFSGEIEITAPEAVERLLSEKDFRSDEGGGSFELTDPVRADEIIAEHYRKELNDNVCQ